MFFESFKTRFADNDLITKLKAKQGIQNGPLFRYHWKK